MALRPQWPDILEEEAYLVQLVSETPQDSGVLEQTTDTLEILRTDLQSCISKHADLERDIRDSESKGSPPSSSSSATRFFHRITESISSDHHHEEREREQEVQSDRLLDVTTRERTLRMEVKNLETKIQILRRRIRHHEEVKHRLKELYDRIFDGSKISSPEEEEAEKDVRKAQQTLHQTQKTMERHKTLMALLGYGDFALSNAEPHLSSAAQKGKEVDPTVFHSEVTAAKTYIVQAYTVVHQAKRLDPNFFEQEKSGDLFKAHWVSSIFRGQRPAAGKRDSRESPLITSQHVLESHHTVLLSLLNLARKRWQEHETSLRRATQWHMEAYGRKQALRKRVLLRIAGVDGDQLPGATDGHKGGLARIKDITAGLDKLIAPLKPEGLLDMDEDRSGIGMDGARQPPNRQDLASPTAQGMQRAASPNLSFYPIPQLDPEDAVRSRQPRPSTPNSMQRAPSPNPAFDSFPQHSPRLSPGGAVTQSRQPSPGPSPLRTPVAEGRTGAPESRAGGLHNPQPSTDGRSEDMLGAAAYSSPRPAPSLPSGSGNRFVESQAHEIRRSPQPPSEVQVKARGPEISSEASTRSHAPRVQSPPSTNSRAEEVGLHAIQSQLPLEISQRGFSPPAMHSAKRIKGILKAPYVAPPPPPTDLSDPWGVQSASAGSSRPKPKLKNMMGKLRGVDGFKPSSNNNNQDSGKGAASNSARDSRSSAHETAHVSPTRQWTSIQKLRFSETVVVIPRPAVDSDPYEDEDEEYMPPSPKRGSVLWHKEGQEEEDEDEEGGGPWAEYSRPGGIPVQVDPAPRKQVATHLPDTASTAPSHPEQQPNAALSPRELLAKQQSRQAPLEHPNSEGGARQRVDLPVTPRAYPEQSRALRPLPDMGRTSSDDIRVEGHRTLTAPEELRGRLMSPSDPNLVASAQARKPAAAPLTPFMTRGGPESRSDHTLVQAIFPSPSSTATERDLLFTRN